MYQPTAKLAPPPLAMYLPLNSQSGENTWGSTAASATTSIPSSMSSLFADPLSRVLNRSRTTGMTVPFG
ncbi:hypothetical protein BE08_04590 [Sorangium cellulosum]|uniref:Uncharacterized protein n=1 Tax=Sorangium cellulosum TaxID=56 RepID=A0A150P5V9_SORCE|nr:hypothetical protein BE08_04590 [Sorangium cellulosum]